jgi:hypothetical protein
MYFIPTYIQTRERERGFFRVNNIVLLNCYMADSEGNSDI